jgi:hypothetical protein
MPDFKEHIWVVILALFLVLFTYVILVLIHGTNPKLMDGVLILIGAIAGLAKGTHQVLVHRAPPEEEEVKKE